MESLKRPFVEALKRKAGRLPDRPGIYLFRAKDSTVVYIGKARSLRDRVRSYFQATADPKVRNILSETADIDVILTDSEKEAAFLENNFVQQYQPKFNLKLKDDKSFPYLKVTVQEAYPRIAFSRRVEPDGARYFGPYVPAHTARQTIRLINKFFGLRGCDEDVPGKRKRPCLEYDLKFCAAPCVGAVSEDSYRENVRNALLFLEGKEKELLKALRDKMTRAADREEFEQAAHWRNLIRTIEAQAQKPRLISVGLEDMDIFGLARQAGTAAVAAFFMRRGKVLESAEFLLRDQAGIPEKDILSRFLKDFYQKRRIAVLTVLVPFPPRGLKNLERELSQKRGRRVRLTVPSRGKNRGLMDMAMDNARSALVQRFEPGTPLDELQKILGLTEPPRRIEGFDISNTGGTETVGSSVVFVDGRPNKDEYRKYKVRSVAGPNDVASLREIVLRRMTRLVHEGGPLPNLILVDGGQGQLAASLEALGALGLSGLPVASLAKREEIVFTPSKREGLVLDRTSPALKLLQHIRDEAHRFAVSFHRRRRTRRSFESLLDGLPGLGPKRRRLLLTRFRSLEEIRKAPLEELQALVGAAAAKAIRERMTNEEKTP